MTAAVMNETLEQFSARMAEVEKEDELVVGQAHRGHSRAIFNFEGQYCYLEQVGYCTYSGLGLPTLTRVVMTAFAPAPHNHWWTDFAAYGKDCCERIAAHYGATLMEDPYAEDDWYCFVFHGDDEGDDGFDKLMRFVHDRHTGEFERLFGEESERTDGE